MDEPMCRICRRQSDHLESLQGIRESLPISMLVMMICPIKIYLKEKFMPSFICEDCLEILLSAHKLRDESLESDRYFRDCYEAENLVEEEEEYPLEIKQETPVQLYVEQWQTPRKLKKRDSKPHSSTSGEDFNYEVDCFKKGTTKSPAWDYFGRLIYTNGDIVSNEQGYYFCRLCVNDKRTIKNRYKSDNISTGMIFTHLKAAHGITKGSRYSPTLSNMGSGSAQKPQVQGQTFTCTEDGCGKTFMLKMCLDIHLGLEHTGIADEPPIQTEFLVNLEQKDPRATSMAWKYFGVLLDAQHEMIDDNHYYCRLCVGVGDLTKYNKSCSTTTLFQHLRAQHLRNTVKRKRFSTADVTDTIE